MSYLLAYLAAWVRYIRVHRGASCDVDDALVFVKLTCVCMSALLDHLAPETGVYETFGNRRQVGIQTRVVITHRCMLFLPPFAALRWLPPAVIQNDEIGKTS